MIAPRVALAALIALLVVTLAACSSPPLHPNGSASLPAVAGGPSGPARVVAFVTLRGPAAPASTVAAAARCAAGATVSGGGVSTTLIGGRRPPSSLHADGTAPTGPGGKPPAVSGGGALGWVGLGATGGQLVIGGVTTAYAICLHGASLGKTSTVVATVPGPGVATTTSRATALCPSHGLLLGGGGSATVVKGSASPSLHLIGSFPSDAGGTPAAASSTDPTAWSAVADAGGRTGSGVQTTAFAICGLAPQTHTVIAAADVGGPLPASAQTTAVATCPSSTELISGGANTGPRTGSPQQGLHLTGSFPANAAGLGVGFGPAAESINSWTARAESGGQGSPSGTSTKAFAVCLRG
jgi:hypothetical protein